MQSLGFWLRSGPPSSSKVGSNSKEPFSITGMFQEMSIAKQMNEKSFNILKLITLEPTPWKRELKPSAQRKIWFLTHYNLYS